MLWKIALQHEQHQMDWIGQLKRRHDDWNIFQTITSLKGLNSEEKDREGEEDDLA